MENLYSEPFAAALFLALGLVLLFLEVFIPSGGILGILAVLSAGFGAFGFYHQGHPLMATLSVVGFSAYGLAILRFVFKRLSFRGEMSPATSSSVDTRLSKTLVAARGRTLTPLRPAGMALVDGQRIDVVSAGSFIDKDAEIVVIEVAGNRVVVKESKNPTNPEKGTPSPS